MKIQTKQDFDHTSNAASRNQLCCSLNQYALPTEPCHHVSATGQSVEVTSRDYRLSHATTRLMFRPQGTDNKDNISNCLPSLNPLIIGFSGDRRACPQHFTCRSGSVVRTSDSACLLALLPEVWVLSENGRKNERKFLRLILRLIAGIVFDIHIYHLIVTPIMSAKQLLIMVQLLFLSSDKASLIAFCF